jgi:hypothetical protein
MTRIPLTVGVHAGCGIHCLSHSRRQRTKPELGFMHGRRWRTNVMAESNDMPRLRMRYAITIAAERETPYAGRMRINISYTHATASQSLKATMKVVGRRWIDSKGGIKLTC